MKLSNVQRGYISLAVTMSIWFSFVLLSRVSVHQSINAWDLATLRYSVATIILLPILIYRGELKILLQKHYLILGIVGGILFPVFIYTGYQLAPAAHAVIWCNGLIPIFTGIAAVIILKQAFDKNLKLSFLAIFLGITIMTLLLSYEGMWQPNIGDLFFLIAAICWGVYTALLKKWGDLGMTAWLSMCGVAIWSAVLYIPFYWLFLPKQVANAQLYHIIEQSLFHGVFVVIIATLSFIKAVKYLGAFKAASLLSIAPFAAGLAASPLLKEPLNIAIFIGLLGMLIGATQPWRWLANDK